MKEYTSLLLSLLLFLGSLFPQTDVEEVFKIPQLLPHYLEHKQTAQLDFDFLDFLILHYSPGSDHAQTPHPSTNIPMHNHVMTGMAFIMPDLLQVDLYTFNPCTIYQSIYKNTYSYVFAYSFLQPPQHA
jgi:hypothetical protein